MQRELVRASMSIAAFSGGISDAKQNYISCEQDDIDSEICRY